MCEVRVGETARSGGWPVRGACPGAATSGEAAMSCKSGRHWRIRGGGWTSSTPRTIRRRSADTFVVAFGRVGAAAARGRSAQSAASPSTQPAG